MQSHTLFILQLMVIDSLAASMSQLLNLRNVLLLQGKMGGFFNRFSTFLQTQDIKVSKINFNAGDAFFYHHPNTYEYTDTLAQFSAWLQAFIEKHNIDAVVCFGDCRRTIHKQAV